MDIHHDAGTQQFRVDVDGHRGELDYTLHAGVMTLTHTGVPPPIGGRGIAAELTRAALDTARGTDARIDTLDDALAAARETARLSPAARGTRDDVARYARTVGQIDFAVRNPRVLARSALRHTRPGRQAPPELAGAVRDLSVAVWELAAAYDEPRRSDDVIRLARAAAGRAAGVAERAEEPDALEVAGQVRSTAVDLVRAAELVSDSAHAPEELPTEELLLAS